MNDFACDQHTPQPFARHDEFLERSYMVITQTALLHGCCKCLQLKGSHHTTSAFDRVSLPFIGCIIVAGCRVPQDISVTGFDKTRLADYSNPSITTGTVMNAVSTISGSEMPSTPSA